MDILLQVKPRNKKASGKVELQCSAVPVIYNRLARTANFILLLVRAQNQIDNREIYENYGLQLDVAHLIETFSFTKQLKLNFHIPRRFIIHRQN
jgi:hypothetical protein